MPDEQRWSAGDRSELEELTPIIHAELYKIAHRYMNRERDGHTLQTTALVNEAYLRLIDWKAAKFESRAHFSDTNPMNKLDYGDNLDVMRKFIRPICVETVDLCYIDPPFNSRAQLQPDIQQHRHLQPKPRHRHSPTHGRGTTTRTFVTKRS